MKILSKLISDHRCDWLHFVPKAVLAYNTSVRESTLLTPYRLMFGREVILPSDAILRFETAPPQGSVQKYPKYVALQKQQLKETEQLARQNLKPVQKFQKLITNNKCHGQRFLVGDRVWYKNRAMTRRRKFFKLWCGPWRVVKALFDVTHCIEEEARKMSLEEGGPPQLFETMLYAT